MACMRTGAGILAMGAYGQGEYGLAKSISNSPLPFANRDPDDPSLASASAVRSSPVLWSPAARKPTPPPLTTDALTDTARTATSAVKTAAGRHRSLWRRYDLYALHRW